MTEQILIFTDTGKQQTFLKEVEAVKNDASALIVIFEEFQEFKKIRTMQEFELLCSDPLSYFDETIKGNITLKMTGGREPDPVVLADLFGIDRENYSRVIKGLPVTEYCKPCQTSKVIKKGGKPALTYSKYELYKEFLFFEAGAFNLNTEAIADHLEQFKTFANTPAQLSLLKHWQSLVDILNENDRMYGMPAALKLAISKGLSLHLTRAFEGSFMLNPEHLKNEILKNK
jgi:hypothetical protein